MEQKYIVISVLVIAVLIVTAFIYFDRTSATVSAQGYSEIQVQPDKVSVYFQIQSIEDSADTARDNIAKISENVLSALRLAGIEDIETQQYSIYPNYNYREGREITGYTATQTIKVSTSAYDLAGKIVDLGVNNGALVNYINFELSEEKQAEYKSQTLEQASADAKNKAEATATGLGKKLGKVVSITSSDYNYYPYMYWESGIASADAKQAVTNIQPRTLDIRANVQVIFKIY